MQVVFGNQKWIENLLFEHLLEKDFENHMEQQICNRKLIVNKNTE